MKPLFVTGIGTGVGKTVVSAILVEYLKADYWKPVQSGDLENSDTIAVQNLISNPLSVFHPESYRLSQPFSPHKSAELDGVKIELEDIRIPLTDRQLIIEGAGGLMVPLNEKALMIDLIKQLSAEVILVSQNYLGSINHTLLSAEVLKSWNIPLKALIFCGERNTSTENFISNYLNTQAIFIPYFEELNKNTIRDFVIETDLPF